MSNHQPHDGLLYCLFWRRSKKTSNLRVTGLCAGNNRWRVNSPHIWPVTRKCFHLMTSSWFSWNNAGLTLILPQKCMLNKYWSCSAFCMQISSVYSHKNMLRAHSFSFWSTRKRKKTTCIRSIQNYALWGCEVKALDTGHSNIKWLEPGILGEVRKNIHNTRWI